MRIGRHELVPRGPHACVAASAAGAVATSAQLSAWPSVDAIVVVTRPGPFAVAALDAHHSPPQFAISLIARSVARRRLRSLAVSSKAFEARRSAS